jgi:hypothetical protein
VSKRTDIHRDGAFVPADYDPVITYSLPSSCGGMPIPGFGVNCELDYRREVEGEDGKKVSVNGEHAPGMRCCVIALRTSGVRFADHGGLGKCTACGAHFVAGDVWVHRATGEHVHLGHQCADKFHMLIDRSALELEMGRQRDAAARAIVRKQNDEERAAFLAKHPGLEDALKVEHRIIADIAARFVDFRSLSEKQVALVFKLADEVRNPKPEEQERNVPAPEGRVTFRGKVVSTKAYDSDFGTTLKMTVKVETPDGTWLAWGTVPAFILDSSKGPVRGCEVEVTATLKRGRDPHFAMMKRPVGKILHDPNATATEAA